MSLKSIYKGFVGEAMSSIAHKVLLDKNIYRELNNVTIPTPDGTTQIDHVIVSRYGIFVIESKNMSGWIFGAEDDTQWTQTLPGGKKFRFQNPLRQNYKHTKSLSEFLEIDHEKFHSVVMFWGNSSFRTPMPVNVRDRGYPYYIQSKKEELFSDVEVEQIVEAIQTGRLPRTWATRRRHVASLKERHAGSPLSAPDMPACPKCGSSMFKRTAERGVTAGKEFWGCSQYPACKGNKSVPM